MLCVLQLLQFNEHIHVCHPWGAGHQVALWNAKSQIAEENLLNPEEATAQLVKDCDVIKEHLLKHLSTICYLGASSAEMLEVDTGGLLLRTAGILAAAAMLQSSQSDILINAISSATHIEETHIFAFAQVNCMWHRAAAAGCRTGC